MTFACNGGMEHRCKNCRHWKKERPNWQNGVCGIANELPQDHVSEFKARWLDSDGIDHRVDVETGPDFGCVLFEAKEGTPLTWKDVLDDVLEWEASNSPPWDKPVPRKVDGE